MPNPLERDRDLRWSVIALLLVTGGAALLRLVALGNEELWFDEVFSAVLAAQDPADLLRRALADKTNPPGFYLALWLWTRLGGFSVVWMRLLPALAGVALVPAIAWLARTLGMPRGAAILAALLAAVSPLMLAMSLEVRTYSLLALATALTLVAAVRLSRDAKRSTLVALAAGNVVLVSLHYFGLLVVAVTVVGLVWCAGGPLRARLRLAVVTTLPAIATLAVWVLWVIAAARRAPVGAPVGANAAWVPALGMDAAVSFASQVVGTFGTTWGAWIVVLALLASATLAAREASVRAHWLLAAAGLPVLILIAGMAAVHRSLWVARYLVIVLPACWLLFADATWRAEGRVRTAFVAALAGWSLLAGPLAETARPRKPAWSLVVRSLGSNAIVCVNEAFVGLPLEYHALEPGARIEVRTMAACASDHSGGYALIRPGTERSLEGLRAAGARLGPARSLHTRLPDVELLRVDWGPR